MTRRACACCGTARVKGRCGWTATPFASTEGPRAISRPTRNRAPADEYKDRERLLDVHNFLVDNTGGTGRLAKRDTGSCSSLVETWMIAGIRLSTLRVTVPWLRAGEHRTGANRLTPARAGRSQQLSWGGAHGPARRPQPGLLSAATVGRHHAHGRDLRGRSTLCHDGLADQDTRANMQ